MNFVRYSVFEITAGPLPQDRQLSRMTSSFWRPPVTGTGSLNPQLVHPYINHLTDIYLPVCLEHQHNKLVRQSGIFFCFIIHLDATFWFNFGLRSCHTFHAFTMCFGTSITLISAENKTFLTFVISQCSVAFEFKITPFTCWLC